MQQQPGAIPQGFGLFVQRPFVDLPFWDVVSHATSHPLALQRTGLEARQQTTFCRLPRPKKDPDGPDCPMDVLATDA